MNRIDLDRVLRTLEQLGIPHKFSGPAHPITKVCSLLHREPHGLYYYTGSAPGPFATLQDSVVLCTAAALGDLAGNAAIVVEGDPQVVFYRLCAALFPARPEPGIHPTAVVHPEAVIADGVYIGPYAVVGRAQIGRDSAIHAHVVLMDGCVIGERVVIEANSCIGATGAVWVWGEQHERVVLPLLGGVVIEDDVFLATDTSIVRGAFNESTFIGRGSMLAPGCKVGHSVRIEAMCHFANNVSIAGSAIIGARSFIGSGASVRSHARLAEDTVVGSGAAVVKSVERPGLTIAGVPAVEIAGERDRVGVPRRRRS